MALRKFNVQNVALEIEERMLDAPEGVKAQVRAHVR